VLAAGQGETSDCDHAHAADGFTDHGKRVVADLAIWHQIIREYQIAGSISDFGTNSSMSMVRFESSANVFKFVIGEFNVAIGVYLVALHDIV
jgi:hypothetical protein